MRKREGNLKPKARPPGRRDKKTQAGFPITHTSTAHWTALFLCQLTSHSRAASRPTANPPFFRKKGKPPSLVLVWKLKGHKHTDTKRKDQGQCNERQQTHVQGATKESDKKFYRKTKHNGGAKRRWWMHGLETSSNPHTMTLLRWSEEGVSLRKKRKKEVTVSCMAQSSLRP